MRRFTFCDKIVSMRTEEDILYRCRVIRLRQPDILSEMFEAQNHICDLCRYIIDNLLAASLDHSTPVILFARGPLVIEEAARRANLLSNLRAVHATCNSCKHDMPRAKWFSTGRNKEVEKPIPFDIISWEKQQQAKRYWWEQFRATSEGVLWLEKRAAAVTISNKDPLSNAKRQVARLACWKDEVFREKQRAGCIAAQQRHDVIAAKTAAGQKLSNDTAFKNTMTKINRERMLSRSEHPTWNRNQRAALAKRTAENDEWRKNTSEANRRQASNPIWLAANKDGQQRRHANLFLADALIAEVRASQSAINSPQA